MFDSLPYTPLHQQRFAGVLTEFGLVLISLGSWVGLTSKCEELWRLSRGFVEVILYLVDTILCLCVGYATLEVNFVLGFSLGKARQLKKASFSNGTVKFM
jgi:hypothetical protein